MAVTRSKKVTVTTITPEVTKVKKTTKVLKLSNGGDLHTTRKVETEAVAVSRSPKKKAPPKLHIEEHFRHITVPDDLRLPADFVEFHDEEFINGVKHILQGDSSLYPAICHANFNAFAKQTDDGEKSDDEVIKDYWYALIRSILGQQISGSAAAAIEKRFNELFEGKPTPEDTLKIPQDKLKAVGLLSMKLKYIVHISETFSQPDSNLTSVEFYTKASQDEVIQELTQLKGIGEWSAKMFSVFTLRDLDVFAYDDLGVARGVARYLKVRPDLLEQVKSGVHAVEKLKNGLKKKGKFQTKTSKREWVPLHDEFVKYLGLMYAPYQLVFMLIMWRLASTNIDVLENVR